LLKRFAIIVVLAIAVTAPPCYAQGLEALAKKPTQMTDLSHENEFRHDEYAYILSVDDIIKVKVHGEDDLSSTYKIDSAGMISFPLIGEIKVQGLSAQQVEQLIKAKLSDGYLVNPSISVEHVSVDTKVQRPFYILGEVRNPGSYKFTSGVTVFEAVSIAGGFTYRANKKNVQILKTKNSSSEFYEKVPVEQVIDSGDIILIKESFF